MTSSPLTLTDCGCGPVILLLHAFPCHRHMWREQVEPLVGRGWRVIVPDLPGFGESPEAVDEPSLTSMAGPVLEALDGIGSFVVGGLSMGGYLAMEVLRQDPARVAALMLFDTKAGADTEQARVGRLGIADRVEAEGRTGFLVPEMIANLLGDTTRETRPDLVARVSRWITSARPGAVAWAQRAMASRPDSRPDLAEYEGPALVVYGDQDTISPRADATEMAGLLRNSRLETIADSGHLSAVERPDAVSDVIEGFVGPLRARLA
ncbi:MAG: alpha/beta hydrolase [Candidatus Nanopelagicales bacterium]|nr:alpha/beta hydrolase [Candidatus Nanopelagicales bacterium]